jgi:hypothetical protein
MTLLTASAGCAAACRKLSDICCAVVLTLLKTIHIQAVRSGLRNEAAGCRPRLVHLQSVKFLADYSHV